MPLTVPDRPDPDEIITSTWGDWVHDTLNGLGRIGRVAKTTADVGLGSGAVADYGGLSIAFTAKASRVYRAHLYGRFTSAAANLLTLYIADGANVQYQEHASAPQTFGMVNLWADVTPPAGAFTLKVRYNILGGGSVDSVATATRPLVFDVTDMGPA